MGALRAMKNLRHAMESFSGWFFLKIIYVKNEDFGINKSTE